VLNARFEGICMRLFSPITRPLGIASSAAKRVFGNELALALAALEEEREQAYFPTMNSAVSRLFSPSMRRVVAF
jgi:hypothetical protein